MKTNERLYYLDWLRILAFGLLFLFHSWMPFNQFPWHIKNEEQTVFFDILTMFSHGWRMSLIFLVSGAGTWLAMRARKGEFVIDRLKRLIVPFIFGVLVIIPPQRFYEWIMFRDLHGNYFDFLWMYPAQQLGDNMGASVLLWFGHLGTHLWYLPFLFVMTVFTLPFLNSIRKGQINFSWLKKIMSSKIGIFILILPMLIFRFALKPIFNDSTDWADFFFYVWPFIYGFIFMTDDAFIEIIKKKTSILLNVGVLSSFIFIYAAMQYKEMIELYLNPEFSLSHLGLSFLAALIAMSWILFFVGFFAKNMNFNHRILIPANISILPIYVLHQSLIIVFGYYIVGLDLNVYLKFALIACIAIPASILIYKLIQTNNITRFLFGLKPLTNNKEVTIRRVYRKIANKIA